MGRLRISGGHCFSGRYWLSGRHGGLQRTGLRSSGLGLARLGIRGGGIAVGVAERTHRAAGSQVSAPQFAFGAWVVKTS